MAEDLAAALARIVRAAREEQGLTRARLADDSGVSRAMIARIEQAEAQPTAALLARLSAGLGLTLSKLIARAESDGSRVRRADAQPTWTDPDTGYTRRAVSPSGSRLELVDVLLPQGARVDYPADAYRALDQQVWVLEGTLRIIEGTSESTLGPGDCLTLGAPSPTSFRSEGEGGCRYVVALAKRSPHEPGPRS
ncbi:helix-turn-helix domain-containing protein [Brachybacterium sp. MASK1Z-5]|uniref:Helix-turn-helix domain-containing protein n=1 Tax=Brachybacterium halotolerans TaxID=2795215 RepID=A0ABS1BA02_9MICO|nr:XRE family transcriptional regulator [Brachybacterium halotolerans]MBK0331327.1 helix-turn-helix domain-containing protein [Brachybacterium halotolerans]